jgi:hypothetical protein
LVSTQGTIESTSHITILFSLCLILFNLTPPLSLSFNELSHTKYGKMKRETGWKLRNQVASSENRQTQGAIDKRQEAGDTWRMNADNQELDAGDFEPAPHMASPVASEQPIENASQSSKGSKGAMEGAAGEPQLIKTKLRKGDWDRRKIIDWQSIKEAILAGMRVEDAATRYGSTVGSIRVRSHAEQWPTPERIKQAAERQIKEAQERLLHARMLRANGRPAANGNGGGGKGTGNGGNVAAGGEEGDEFDGEGGEIAYKAGSGSENIAVTLGGDLAAMAESGTLHAARRALRSLKQAPDSLPIRGASDLAILAKLLRSMAGLDPPQVALTLGLFTSSQPDAASLGVVLEAEDLGE